MPDLIDPAALRDEIESARALFQGGKATLARDEFRALLSRLGRAGDERTEVVAAQARLLLGLALAEFEVSGDFDEAMALFDRAERAVEESGAGALTATIHGQRALLHHRRGENVAALAAFDKAVLSFDAAPVYDQMTILLNRSALHLDRGELDEASEDLQRCIELAMAEGEQVLEFKALHNLGYVEFLAGRLPRALRILEQAEGRNPGDMHAVSLLDRARVLREAGLLDDAERLLERASELLADSGVHQDLAETELVRAECALVDGNVKQARALALSANRRFARRHNLRWQRRAELMRLRADRVAAEEKGSGSRVTALLEVAQRASDLADACRREGRRDLARTAGLVALEARLRARPHEALRPPVVRSLDALPDRLRAREVRALAARNAGSRHRAAGEVRKGLAELGSYQHSFGSLDLRTASAVHGSALARLGLEIAMESGSPTAVLDHIELSRAISTRLPGVRPPEDEETADLLAELRGVEETARALEGDAASESELERLRARGLELEKAIRARAWELEGEHGAVDAAPRSGELRAAAAEDGVAFVSFARHARRWVAVVVDGRRSSLHDLADLDEVTSLVHRVRADLDALAMPALPPPLEGAVRRSLDLGLARLDTLLVQPLRLGARPAVLSCSGELLFLPWGLTPGRAGVSTVVTPSASGWLRGRRRTRPERPRVVAVAGPDLRLSTPEVTAVAGIWEGSEALVGGAATAAETRGGLVRGDLVHVAAHGVHRPESPLFSSVRMADGPLFAYEIDPAEGLAGCVFLAACDAGLATTRPGDENLGMASVLLQLGVATVVAGVSRINDEVSAGVMVQVHEDVAQGIDVSSSLATRLHETLSRHTPAALLCLGSSW